jgi:phosphonate transport system ATP-binding protein
LSGGQQQRVGIARSLILDPKIILADEPISSLDPSSSIEIMTLLQSLAVNTGRLVLCSLHQVEMAKNFAD